MDAIFQRRGIFYKFECSCKDCIEAFNFCVQIKEHVKYVKKFKEIIMYIFLFFYCSFLFSFTNAYSDPVQPLEGGSFDDKLKICLLLLLLLLLLFIYFAL